MTFEPAPLGPVTVTWPDLPLLGFPEVAAVLYAVCGTLATLAGVCLSIAFLSVR